MSGIITPSDTTGTTNTTSFHYVSINGVPCPDESSGATAVSIWDTSFHRGDGVFEVMRVLPSGRIRGLDLHLTRLATSANAVGCPLPTPETLQTWLQDAASAAVSFYKGDDASGALRLIATKGGSSPSGSHVILPSVIISWSPLPPWPESFTLCPILAPWHCAGATGWETPIKWTSYGPNVVSTQKAKAKGFADALLLSSSRLSNPWNPNLEECHVLDGPNFAISWIRNSTLYLPDSKALGLLPSITQDLVRQIAEEKLGMTVERGIYTLAEVFQAEEVYITSTTRGIIPVAAIGDRVFSKETPKIRQLKVHLEKLNSEGEA